MSFELDEKAMRVVGRWSRDELYVRILPLTSAFAEPEKPARQYWVVEVELRDGTRFTPWRAEGYDLSKLIRKLGREIPRRPIHPDFAGKRKAVRGWPAPRKLKKKRKPKK